MRRKRTSKRVSVEVNKLVEKLASQIKTEYSDNQPFSVTKLKLKAAAARKTLTDEDFSRLSC